MKNYETQVYDYVDKNTGIHIVKAVATFEGKSIYAYAKCDPDDTFDLTLGTNIALKRLELKIAKKRAAWMSDYLKFCQMNLNFIEQEKRRIKRAKERAEIANSDRNVEVNELEAELSHMLENIK